MSMFRTSIMPPVVNGLVGWWKLDENTGTIAKDSSISAKDGTLLGTTLPTWTAGVMGGALSFDGSSSYVETQAPATKATTNVTLAAWFKTRNHTQAGQYIVHNGSDASSNGYGFAVNSESTTTGEIRLLYSSITWFATGFIVQDNTWYHGVMVIDSGRVPRLYINGALVYTGPSFTINAPTLRVDIGRNDYSSTYARFFNGFIDDVRIYNRALAASEVLSLYNSYL